MAGPAEMLPWVMQRLGSGQGSGSCRSTQRCPRVPWVGPGPGRHLTFPPPHLGPSLSLSDTILQGWGSQQALAPGPGPLPMPVGSPSPALAPGSAALGAGSDAALAASCIFAVKQFGTPKQTCHINRRETFAGSPACPLASVLAPALACITARGGGRAGLPWGHHTACP